MPISPSVPGSGTDTPVDAPALMLMALWYIERIGGLEARGRRIHRTLRVDDDLADPPTRCQRRPFRAALEARFDGDGVDVALRQAQVIGAELRGLRPGGSGLRAAPDVQPTAS